MTHLSNLVNFQRPRGRSRRLLLLFSMVEELLLLEPLCTTTTDCVYLACFWPFVWPFRFLLLFTFGTIFLFFDSFLGHVGTSQWHRPKVFRRNFMILVTHCRVILTSARACEYFLPTQLVSQYSRYSLWLARKAIYNFSGGTAVAAVGQQIEIRCYFMNL